MQYHLMDILTLDNDQDYIVIDIVEYQNNQYMLLRNLNNKESLYVLVKENGNIIALDKKRKELITELSKLFAKDSKKILNSLKDTIN